MTSTNRARVPWGITLAIICGMFGFLLLGYSNVDSAATSLPKTEPVSMTIVNQLQPRDIIITAPASGTICITVRIGQKGAGSSCTRPDADKAMIALSGSNTEGQHLLTILDPTQRATQVNVLVNGNWTPLTLQHREGVAVAVTEVTTIPDAVEVVDASGTTLQSQQLRGSYTQAEQELQNQLAHPERHSH